MSPALPILSILTGVRWHLTVVLICFSLTTRDVGTPSHMLIRHLFIFLGEASVQSSAHFVIGLFSSFWILRTLCIFWVPVLYHTRALQIHRLNSTGLNCTGPLPQGYFSTVNTTVLQSLWLVEPEDVDYKSYVN